MNHANASDRLIIANCSGFYGDRLDAAKEMVEGGPIHVLSGDYLAELTMAILKKDTLKDPGLGYARTFLRQMEAVMGPCLDRKIRVVSNAGGLHPTAMAEKLHEIAGKLGLHPKIACITGDDLMGRLDELHDTGEAFVHMDKKTGLREAGAVPITANAYLGGWGIAAALAEDADIVICGRVADAALVAGPAAWHFGWARNDWDRLAGAYAAGHIIECGAQATGGNYSFIGEVPTYKNIGFPIAEMFEDGSFTITKHPGTGGIVSTGTVTAQLLYEIREPGYLTPDVTIRLDTLRLVQEGPDRVFVSGTKGEPPPESTKVCINTSGGYRSAMTLILTGLDIEKKAKAIEDTLFASLGGKQQFESADVRIFRQDKADPPTNEEAFAYLQITVTDPEEKKVTPFSRRFVELTLASIPGFTPTGPPSRPSQVIVHWPSLVSMAHLRQSVHIGDKTITVKEATPAGGSAEPVRQSAPQMPDLPDEPTVRSPLGRVFATRSGDKGGNANLGVWAKTPEAYSFLQGFLTTEKLKELLPDCAAYEIERYRLPNLLALNFYIRGILGDGAAASLRIDPQGKTLGEYLRARVIEMPEVIVPKTG